MFNKLMKNSVRNFGGTIVIFNFQNIDSPMDSMYKKKEFFLTSLMFEFFRNINIVVNERPL